MVTSDNPFVLTLTPKQQSDLGKFKDLLAAKGAYTHASEDKPASTDDLTLTRFLRARRWVAAPAAEQYLATLAWRKEYDVDNYYRKEVDPEEFEGWKQIYPKWTGRRDKWGNPLYVYKLSVLSSSVLKELGKVPEEVRYRHVVALYELLHNLAFPTCLSLPISPPPSSTSSLTALPPPDKLAEDQVRLVQNTTIIDFAGTTLGSMFNFRGHLQQASTLAQANHPETLGVIFVVGAPGWWGTVWGWIKGWFDEQTRNKVHILPNPLPPAPNALTALIPLHSLPKIYGGSLEWEYEDEPAWDADAELLLRELGAPVSEDGKVQVRGPVVLRPRSSGLGAEGEGSARLEFVGKGRYSVGKEIGGRGTGVEEKEKAVGAGEEKEKEEVEEDEEEEDERETEQAYALPPLKAQEKGAAQAQPPTVQEQAPAPVQSPASIPPPPPAPVHTHSSAPVQAVGSERPLPAVQSQIQSPPPAPTPAPAPGLVLAPTQPTTLTKSQILPLDDVPVVAILPPPTPQPAPAEPLAALAPPMSSLSLAGSGEGKAGKKLAPPLSMALLGGAKKGAENGVAR